MGGLEWKKRQIEDYNIPRIVLGRLLDGLCCLVGQLGAIISNLVGLGLKRCQNEYYNIYLAGFPVLAGPGTLAACQLGATISDLDGLVWKTIHTGDFNAQLGIVQSSNYSGFELIQS